jgi:hypothetical protein
MTRVPVRPARRLIAVLALALAAALGLLPGVGVSPAGAHDGDAVFEVEAHPAGLAIHYIVRVTWADDGHPAEGATVTATAIGADGTQLTPVPLVQSDSDGRYTGVLEYPSAGTWTLRITSIDPNGTLQQAQEVTPPPTTTAPPSEVTTGPGDATGSDPESGETGGFAPADDDTGGSDDGDEEATGSGDGSDDGSGMPLALILAAIVVIGGAVAAVTLLRRSGPSDGDAAEAGGADGSGPDGADGDGTEAAPAGADAAATASTARPGSDEGVSTPGGGAPDGVGSTPAS